MHYYRLVNAIHGLRRWRSPILTQSRKEEEEKEEAHAETLRRGEDGFCDFACASARHVHNDETD